MGWILSVNKHTIIFHLSHESPYFTNRTFNTVEQSFSSFTQIYRAWPEVNSLFCVVKASTCLRVKVAASKTAVVSLRTKIRTKSSLLKLYFNDFFQEEFSRETWGDLSHFERLRKQDKNIFKVTLFSVLKFYQH